LTIVANGIRSPGAEKNTSPQAASGAPLSGPATTTSTPSRPPMNVMSSSSVIDRS